MEREAGMEVFFIPCRKGFTLRRLREGRVRARAANLTNSPFPRKRESPCHLIVLGVQCQKDS